MEQFKESVVILYSTPIYIIIIMAEMIASYVSKKHYYTLKDTLTNIYLSALNFLLDFALRVFYLFVLGYFYSLTKWRIENIYLYWFTLLILEDIAFYFLHRVDHFCRFFWAVHVTHHSSENYNLTVGFRSSVFQPLYRFLYFIPIALLGFKPEDIMLMYAITQIWGILIHTQYIGKLGFLETFMATPSHHRVHHASNIKYLDKNMGMVFIVWDKLFGTFQKEEENYEPIKFGLTKPLNSYHPIKVIFHEWQNIWNDLKKSKKIKDKLMYIFGPPGWSHDGSSLTSKALQKKL